MLCFFFFSEKEIKYSREPKTMPQSTTPVLHSAWMRKGKPGQQEQAIQPSIIQPPPVISPEQIPGFPPVRSYQGRSKATGKMMKFLKIM